MKKAYSVHEAAEAIGLNTAKVYELVRSRDDFPSITIGRRIIIPISALEKWLEKCGNEKLTI